MAMHDPSNVSRLNRTARAAMAVAARAREVSACVSLFARSSAPGPTPEVERAQALRLVIAALACDHPGKPPRFAQVSVPTRWASAIAAILRSQGYRVVAGCSQTPDYTGLTVWLAPHE